LENKTKGDVLQSKTIMQTFWHRAFLEAQIIEWIILNI